MSDYTPDTRQFLVIFLSCFAAFMVGGVILLMVLFVYVLPQSITYSTQNEFSFDDAITIHPVRELIENEPAITLLDDNRIRIDNSGDVVFIPSEMDEVIRFATEVIDYTPSRSLDIVSLARIPRTPVQFTFAPELLGSRMWINLDTSLSRKVNYKSLRTLEESAATYWTEIDQPLLDDPPVVQLPAGQYSYMIHPPSQNEIVTYELFPQKFWVPGSDENVQQEITLYEHGSVTIVTTPFDLSGGYVRLRSQDVYDRLRPNSGLTPRIAHARIDSQTISVPMLPLGTYTLEFASEFSDKALQTHRFDVKPNHNEQIYLSTSFPTLQTFDARIVDSALEPLANTAIVMEYAGYNFRGITDDDGQVSIAYAPMSKRDATLYVGLGTRNKGDAARQLKLSRQVDILSEATTDIVIPNVRSRTIHVLDHEGNYLPNFMLRIRSVDRQYFQRFQSVDGPLTVPFPYEELSIGVIPMIVTPDGLRRIHIEPVHEVTYSVVEQPELRITVPEEAATP